MSQINEQITSKNAVENIIAYSNANGDLIEKFSQSFFLKYFDRQTLEQLEEKNYAHHQMTKEEFVKRFACFICHKPDQTLFLVISLLRVYEQIKNELKVEEIKVADFSNYICEKIINKLQEQPVLTKELAPQKLSPDPKRIREIDINPPLIFFQVQKEIPKISKMKMKKDKKVDQIKPLDRFFFNHEKKQIITLGRLSNYISTYTLTLKQVQKIIPHCQKLAIYSFAFSQKHQRIGCIINTIGLVFWDYSDNFQTQKVIKKFQGQKIYYLDLADYWITTNSGIIYFWNLREEDIQKTIEEKNAVTIHDIKEITHVRCLAITYTFNDGSKSMIMYSYANLKRVSRLRLFNAGSHQLHYNKFTQTVMILGQKVLPIYLVDPKSMDLNLINELVGHQTIITCITDVEDSIIITGDDKGNVRIWDLSCMRCQQIVKIANWLSKLMYVNDFLLFADSRINSVPMEELSKKEPISQMCAIQTFFKFQSSSENEMYMFTRKTCRVLDMNSGRIKKIIELCIDQEISAVQKRSNYFIVGTTKGNLIGYTLQFKKKWKITAHQLEVNHIRIDDKNKFFLSVGKCGNIFVWNQKTFLEEGPRKSLTKSEESRINFDVKLCQLSEEYGIFLIAENKKQISFWDYESCRYCYLLELQQIPSAIKMSKMVPLILIGCMNELIYLYSFHKKQNEISIKFISHINLLFPQSNLHNQLQVFLISQVLKSKEDEFNNMSCTSIQFHHQGGRDKIIISYGRGSVAYFDISSLIRCAFRNQEKIKLNANIQRPIKQNLIKQLNKKQINRVTAPMRKELEYIYEKDKILIWNKKIHKDTINHIEVFEKKYLSTFCIDGYFKLTDLQLGIILCSVNIRHPLPIEWNYKFERNQQFCNQIHKAIEVLSEILNSKHQNQELSNEQFNSLNVQPFLMMVCNPNMKKLTAIQKFSRTSPTIRLLKDELAPQDLRKQNANTNEMSIKYMQAYKRVNDVRKIKGNKQILRPINLDEHKKILIGFEDKENIYNLLNKNYFEKFHSIKLEEKTKSKSIKEFSNLNSFLEKESQNDLCKPPLKRNSRNSRNSINCLLKAKTKSLCESNLQLFKKNLPKSEPMCSISGFLKTIDKKRLLMKNGKNKRRFEFQ